MSIISAQRLRECQGFIDKVGEIRFTKVKQRQLNKYNILLNKKEGNTTGANATTNPSNLGSQAGRQASTLLPPGEGSNLSQACRQAVTPLPSGEGSNLTQAGTLLPSGEGSNLSQAGRQAGALLPPREGSISFQATVHLPPREGSNSPLATAHLPTREGSNSPQTTAQFPTGEVSSSSQATVHPPPGEGNSSYQSTTLPSPGEGSGNSQAGNQARSGKQVFRHSTRHRAPRLPRGTALPPRQTALTPGKATPPLPSPVGFPKGLLMKNLTLSGSLTYPANFWPQLKGLFLLKDPTLHFPPGNLLT